MKNKKLKLNNKGFSLIELVVVIAILAVLAGVVAPQVFKYIEKSRQAADETNVATIEAAVSLALTNETVYDSVTTFLETTDTLEYTFNGEGPAASPVPAVFTNEVLTILGGKWPSVKAKGNAGYKISINKDLNVTVDIIPATK